jgi:serine phosphatase RsbU (regulator of sigma subunit)
MSVAGPATFAIENARLVERMIEEARQRQELEMENDRRAKELEEARQLQLSLLPQSVPQLPHLEIAAYMKTATEVGGDYYDFYLAEDGTLTVAIGDATGHGLRAGTMVTAAKSIFETLAHHSDLAHILQRVNRTLRRLRLRSLFMALAMVKVRGHQLTVSSAGMPPILIYCAASGEVEEILLRGMPLGSVADYPYQQRERTLSPGDVVALLSDGLPERFNTDGEMFDYERTKCALAEGVSYSPQQIIEHLATSGDDWAAGARKTMMSLSLC